jgi:hypothetical protein
MDLVFFAPFAIFVFKTSGDRSSRSSVPHQKSPSLFLGSFILELTNQALSTFRLLQPHVIGTATFHSYFRTHPRR